MPRSVPLAPLLTASLLLAACSGGESPAPTAARAAPAKKPARHVESAVLPCDVGARPGYFVPGGRRLALLGCAYLGVSGKHVEFSGSVTRIDGETSACINPAFGRGGRRGSYIPAVCKLRPAIPRFAVHDTAQRRHRVPGYGYVLWGIAGPDTAAVSADFDGGTARAAVIAVRPKLARRFDEPPFSVFVLELPRAAACGVVNVRAGLVTDRIPPRRTLCRRG